MWGFALCLILRYLFVSIIAKYQLCNPHGETVLAGLARLHPLFALMVLTGTLLLTHGIGVFLLVGTAEICIKVTGIGNIPVWGAGLALTVLLLVFRPDYRRIEAIFFILAGALSVSLDRTGKLVRSVGGRDRPGNSGPAGARDPGAIRRHLPHGGHGGSHRRQPGKPPLSLLHAGEGVDDSGPPPGPAIRPDPGNHRSHRPGPLHLDRGSRDSPPQEHPGRGPGEPLATPGRNHGGPGLLPLLSGRLRGAVQLHGGERHRLCPAHRRRLHSASACGAGSLRRRLQAAPRLPPGHLLGGPLTPDLGVHGPLGLRGADGDGQRGAGGGPSLPGDRSLDPDGAPSPISEPSTATAGGKTCWWDSCSPRRRSADTSRP